MTVKEKVRPRDGRGMAEGWLRDHKGSNVRVVREPHPCDKDGIYVDGEGEEQTSAMLFGDTPSV